MSLHDQPFYPELYPTLTHSCGFALREDIAFTNSKGIASKSIRRFALKAFEKLRTPLARVLEQGETVLFVSKGIEPLSLVQQLTMSWIMYGYYGVRIVVTDRRLIVFGVTSSGVWRGNIRAIRWSEVESVKSGGFISPSLNLKTNSGKIQFLSVGVANAKKLKNLLSRVREEASREAKRGDGMVSLCPRCSQPLAPRAYICQQCGLKFKSETTLIWRTLRPAGPYFYVNLTGIGVLTSIFEAVWYLALIGSLIDRDATGATLVIAVLAFEKVVMYYHALHFVRGFMPENIADVAEPPQMSSSAAGSGS